MNKRLLIIEDNQKITSLLKKYLEGYGYEVLIALEPQAGLAIFRDAHPDLIILDIMLPGMSGLEVCKRIRKDSEVPIIMLTARGEVNDRIVGLELGADDYMAKPFEPRELVARIEAVIRRTERNTSSPQRIIRKGELELDLDKQMALLSGKNIDLTTKEFETLALLAQSPNRVWNRDQIMEKIRGIDWEAYDRSIDVLISRLRQKLGEDPKDPRYIKTVWGAGYKFIGT